MDRKDFLRTCASGLCACAAACLMAPVGSSAAEATKLEDWRLPFVKKRYAQFLDILSSHMDEKTIRIAMRELGALCASSLDETAKKYSGDIDGFCLYLAQGESGSAVVRDKDVVTVALAKVGDCVCPLNSRFSATPGIVCECSVGWQQHVWETVLQHKPRVIVKESVLRDGERCIFEIMTA